jgi:hypothetical protein
MFGPGKYDDLCKQIKDSTKAKGLLLVILDGDRGTGASCKMDFEIVKQMPNILRAVADEMEQGTNQLLKIMEGGNQG